MPPTPEDLVPKLFNLGAPKVFVLCVLLVLWNKDIDFHKELDFIEHFAGSAALTQEARGFGYKAAAVDKIYGRGLDILRPSGFGTFIATALTGKSSGFLDWCGVLCSSWVSMAKGATHRSHCLPHGYTEHRAVAEGNVMAARVALLALLVTALGGNWVIEQPRSSLLFQHERFQWLCKRFKIFRICIWMGSFNAPTPKPTLLWSSTAAISGFWTGRFHLKDFKEKENRAGYLKPVRRYTDSKGRRKYQGTRDLTKTGKYTRGFARRMVNLFDDLVKQPLELKLQVGHPVATGSALEMFATATYSDMCEDAEIVQAIAYLRGCTGLCIPAEWKPLVPEFL